MATVRINPPPNPKPESVEIVTGPKSAPEQHRIVVVPRGSRPQVNGYEIDYIYTPQNGAHYETAVVRFWLSLDDMRELVTGLADLTNMGVTDRA